MIEPVRVKIWNIVASGNTQHEGQQHGSARLTAKLRNFSRPDTFVGLRAWNDDAERFASFIANNSPWAPIVNLFAYSWGNGNFGRNLAAALHSQNIRIENWIACDPVYRSKMAEYIPGFGHMARAIGVLRQADIKIPVNVMRVQSFVQANKIPRGARIVATSPMTMIEQPIDLSSKGYGHNEMDEAEEWHSAAIRCAERYA